MDQGKEIGAIDVARQHTARHMGLPPCIESLDTLFGVCANESIRVANRYGLTTCEARLALLIAKGCTPSRVASKLGVSLNTVRSHLKRVFAKTDTHRQAELVSLLLTVLYSSEA